MITQSLEKKTVNAGRVGGPGKGKVRERKDQEGRRHGNREREGKEMDIRNRGEGKREENERIERTER